MGYFTIYHIIALVIIFILFLAFLFLSIKEKKGFSSAKYGAAKYICHDLC